MTVTPVKPVRYHSPPASNPPAPVFATTKNATANAVLSTLDQAVAPLRELPNSEDGAAGKVSKAVGGALGVINAPAMFIDTATSIGVSKLDKFLASKLGLPTLFPALPVARIGVTFHMGTPHTHIHPPSTTPPAPPIPLPSFGVAFLAGSASVLVNGIPALRAGDVGIGFTCGSAAPPFEIMTGAAGVYFAGARVARLGMDITFHCNPSPASAAAAAKVAKPFMNVGKMAAAMGAAGAVAGGAGAIDAYEKGNMTAAAVQAAQMGLDAAALALSMLRGKDPAGPPGVGALIGPPPTVVAGGAPIPNIGAWAQGKIFHQIGRALRGLKNKMKRKSPSADANGPRCQGSEPVHLVTGENYNTHTDFKSFYGAFTWCRHMTSARATQPGRLGYCFRHIFECYLEIRLHRFVYHGYAGERIEFPRFTHEKREAAVNGYRLTQLSETHYRLSERRLGSLEFLQANARSTQAYPVTCESRSARAELLYRQDGLLVEIRETPLIADVPQAIYTLQYDPMGRLVEIQGDDLGPQPSAMGQSVAPVQPPLASLPQAQATTSGSASRPALRRLAAYSYDSAGHLVTAEDPLGAQEHYVFDRRHRPTQATDRRGYCFRWEYDLDDRCTLATGDDGLWFARFEYSPRLRQTRMTVHDGSSRLVHYDEDGVITKIVDAYGGELVRHRADDGRIVAETDSGGRRVEFHYNPDGGHIERRDRFGHRHAPQTEQPKLGNPLRIQLPQTHWERVLGTLGTLSLDSNNPLHAVFGTLPEEVAHIADALFDLHSSYRGEPRRERDCYGRIVREIDPRGNERQWQYDATGNPIAYLDRDGRLHRWRICSWNLREAEVDPNGNATVFTYDPHENIASITDPLGTRSEYNYDSKERLTRVIRAGRIREEYVYDQGDRMVAKRNEGGIAILEITPHKNGLSGQVQLATGNKIEFDYDASGQVTRAETSEHRVLQKWDPRCGLLRTSCDGREIAHGYGFGARARTWIAGKYEILYWVVQTGTHEGHDSSDHWIIAPNGFRWVIRRCDRGVVRIQHGDHDLASQEVQQYTPEGRLQARIAWRAARKSVSAADTIESWSTRYIYSSEGDLLEVRDTLRGTRTFIVDEAHRLVAERAPEGTRLGYPLDEAGNLLSKPDLPLVKLTFGNRLLHAGVESFSYDERGHVAERWTSKTKTRYEHDSYDQLVAVHDGHEIPWTATYDGLRRRVTAGRGERRTHFWWDDNRLAAETAPDGRFRIYVYADERSLVPLGFVDYESAEAPPESGKAYSVFCDQIGLPLRIESADGHVVWLADRLDPYGRIDVRPGAEIEYALRWPGHYFDAETGLHYNRYRYYDPTLGRYIESDPIGCAGGVNVYAYPSNPLVAVDILGLAEHNQHDHPPDEHTATGERAALDTTTETGPKPVIDEHIGQHLPPEEAARIMHERTRGFVEEQAAIAKDQSDARNRTDAKGKQLRENLAKANEHAGKTAQETGAVMKNPDSTPEQKAQAIKAQKEAEASRSEAKKALSDHKEEQRNAPKPPPQEGEAGRVYEPAYDPDTGRMVVVPSGGEQASSRIRLGEPDPTANTQPGKCGMPRAAGVLADDAAAHNRPPPNIQTIQGGYSFRNDGRVEHVNTCGNCRNIANHPENNIQIIRGVPNGVPSDVPDGVRTPLGSTGST